MTIHEQVGKKVRELRVKRGLTQEELAETAGISGHFLSRIENNKEQASLDTIVALATSLKTSPATFIAGNKDASDNDTAKISIAYGKLTPKQKKIALPLVLVLLKSIKEI